MQDFSSLLRLDFILFDEDTSPNLYKEKESFVTRSAKIYSNVYSYDKVDYRSSYHSVTITCQEHGDFIETPANHLTGHYGCPKCKSEARASNTAKRRAEYRHAFISQSTFRYKGKYAYDNVVYVDASTRVIITCPEHGDFTQTPNAHLHQNCGCPTCAELRQQEKRDAKLKTRQAHMKEFK